eukprot:SAG31_NODE_3679_length_3994_cov_3.349422_1_plen_204_part_00
MGRCAECGAEGQDGRHVTCSVCGELYVEAPTPPSAATVLMHGNNPTTPDKQPAFVQTSVTPESTVPPSPLPRMLSPLPPAILCAELHGDKRWTPGRLEAPSLRGDNMPTRCNACGNDYSMIATAHGAFCGSCGCVRNEADSANRTLRQPESLHRTIRSADSGQPALASNGGINFAITCGCAAGRTLCFPCDFSAASAQLASRC